MYDDHRNLCTWKKLPDAQLAEYVYDNGGRLTQQGECTNKTVSSDQVVHVQNWAVRVSRRASSRTTLRATVKKENLLYKCGWSPLEEMSFTYQVSMTLVNGQIVYDHGKINDHVRGEMLTFY